MISGLAMVVTWFGMASVGQAADAPAADPAGPCGLARVVGSISSVDGEKQQIVVAGTTVQVDEDTVLRMGWQSIEFADLAPDQRVAAAGVMTDGVLTAKHVNVRFHGQTGPGRGWGLGADEGDDSVTPPGRLGRGRGFGRGGAGGPGHAGWGRGEKRFGGRGGFGPGPGAGMGGRMRHWLGGQDEPAGDHPWLSGAVLQGTVGSLDSSGGTFVIGGTTVRVDEQTRILSGWEPVEAADLQAGQSVRVRGVWEEDILAARCVIVLPAAAEETAPASR